MSIGHRITWETIMNVLAPGNRPILLAGLLLLATPVIPRSATGQDVLGLYFDPAGTVTSATTTAPYEVVTGYLIIKAPSRATGVDSWECVVEAATEGPPPFVNWVLEGLALNVADPPAFSVGLGSSLPSTGDVLLATATIVVPEAGQEVAFHVLPQDPPSLQDPPGYGYPVHRPLYGSGSELVPLDPASGCLGRASAAINDDGIDPSLHIDVNFNHSSYGFVLENQGDRTAGGTLNITGAGFTYRHGDGPYTDMETTFRLYPGQRLTGNVYADGSGSTGEFLVDTCEGVTAVTVGLPPRPGECVVDSLVLDLGSAPVGGSSYGSFRVSNPGDESISVNVYENSPHFEIHNGGYRVIQGGDYIDFNVVFAPLDYGYHETTIQVGSGDSCGPVLAYGWGMPDTPSCQVSQEGLDFGTVQVGEEAAQAVLIYNYTEQALDGTVELEPGCDGFRIDAGGGPYPLQPGESLQVQVSFVPTGSGVASCLLSTGAECPEVPLQGTGLVPNPSCILDTAELDFGAAEEGTHPSRRVLVTNDGNVPLALLPGVDGPPFRMIYPLSPIQLQPGSSLPVTVGLDTSTEGTYAGTLDLGDNVCGDVQLVATVVPSTAHLDRLGLYFDEAYLQNTVYGVPQGEYPVYLVLKSPSVGGGIAGWQACVLTVGSNEVLGWNLQGDSPVNAGDAPCFDVGLGSPLPTSEAMVLMTLDLLVYNEISRTDFYLEPLPGSPIPDRMVYLVDGDPQVPVAMKTSTGSNWVAQINSPPVAVEMPTPIADVTDGEVRLTWTYHGDRADGFHVYRRIDEGPDERLTSAPVAGVGGAFEFLDRPQVFGPARLTYACAAVEDGVETGRGVEVTVAFSGRPQPVQLVLRPNYPNPFNPSTTVPFEIARPGRVRLAVFDLAGRQIAVLADREFPAGYHEEVWTGTDAAGRRVPSGAYYVRLESGGEIRMRQMMLLK